MAAKAGCSAQVQSGGVGEVEVFPWLVWGLVACKGQSRWPNQKRLGLLARQCARHSPTWVVGEVVLWPLGGSAFVVTMGVPEG